jgi:predicted phosphohydrolase
VKIWATSCLHINPNITALPNEGLLVPSYIEEAIAEMGKGDVVILAGDIVDPAVPFRGTRREVKVLYDLELALKDQTVLFTPGNHDTWFSFYQPPSWRNFPNFTSHWEGRYQDITPSYSVMGFPGFNYLGPSWASHHPTEEIPNIFNDPFDLFNSILHYKPNIIFTHYPFWWHVNGEASRGLTDAILEAGVKKVVFGHLHEPGKWSDAPMFAPHVNVNEGPHIYNVSAVGREQPFVLIDEI